MNDIILTIGITSYNRVRELKRCLQSISYSNPKIIEILVSEDKSPQRLQIQQMVEEFASVSPFNVVFNSNANNLGYDRNLKNIINMARGKYILYMSDDDALYKDAIENILKIIEDYNPAVLYAPFVQTDGSYRRYYAKSYVIQPGTDYLAKHLSDCILFSGLMFKKEIVEKLDAEPFLNKNYFQVYMFLYCITFFGGYYLNKTMVRCIMDGENAYGLSESSDNSPLLADRSSVFSDLEFNKGLFWVIKRFDNEFNKEIFNVYENEYNLRSYTGFAAARRIGVSTLKEYWNKYIENGVKPNLTAKIYYNILLFLGNYISDLLVGLPKKILFIVRNEKR